MKKITNYSTLNKSTIIKFGKYKNKIYSWIINNDRSYAIWLYDNWNGYKEHLCYLSNYEYNLLIKKEYFKKNSNCGVYLIKQSFEGNSYLKIGHSKNVHERIKNHRCSNPFFDFIGYINTADHKELELVLHKNCQHLKYRTEWFIYHSNIEDFFKNHKQFKSGDITNEY